MATNKKITTAVALFVIITAVSFIPNTGANAAPNASGRTGTAKSFLSSVGIPHGSLLPPECISDTAASDCLDRDENGKCYCGLNALFQTIVNVTQLILALTGSLALLMFIYGGAMFILAAGGQERIQQAKQILVTAAVGVAIVFSAWLIVNIVIGAITGGEIHSPAKIFDNFWFNQPSG